MLHLRWAGTYNKQLSIGDAAPDWNGLEGTDGQKHSLADLADKEVIVVCFTCNTCPYAVDYEDRLIALAKKFAAEGNKCALVAINANKVKDDLLPAMQERAKTQGFQLSLPARRDAAGCQELRRDVHAGICRAEQGAQGRLSGRDGRQPRRQEDHQALRRRRRRRRAGRQDLPETAETPAVGCAVRVRASSGK